MIKRLTKLTPILLCALALTGIGTLQTNAVVPAESTFFSTVYIEEARTVSVPSNGDLWPSAWSDDDNVYTSCGDGSGFNTSAGKGDIVVNRLSGHPDNNNLVGTRLASNPFGTTVKHGDVGSIWGDPNIYNRKPTGMVSVGGDLYMAIQDLNWTGVNGPAAFNDAPAATICKSTDKGVTWTWDKTAPMFDNYVFTTIMFLDYGKDNQHAIDNYVYAYGMDYNWRDSFNNAVTDPTKLYLARVPKTSIMDRSTWEFYTGDLSGQNPSWSSDINNRTPVLQDDRRVYTNTNNGATSPKDMTVISQGSVVYNQPLNRYIYTSWTEYTFEFYEAPSPWGPWKRFYTKDFGVYPWSATKYGGYSTNIPSKYISNDGKSMYVQSNTFNGGPFIYGYSLRKLFVEPYTATTPTNSKNNTNLASEAKTVPICKAAHFGNLSYLNDGVLSHNEDSWDGETKTVDWWGYTWPQSYNMNKLVYTTGTMFSDGGWFNDLKVQVRQNQSWVDVAGVSVSPNYPNNSSAGSNTTYTFTFPDTWGDGIRIIGTPGGTQHFTSIAELAVHYANGSGPTTITDDFNGPLGSQWTWNLPVSGPTYSFNGGNFRMSLPSSAIYDQWTAIDNAPKLYRTDMGSGDWTIETKLTLQNFTANTKFHEGLMVKFGNNNYFIWGNLMGKGLELSRSSAPALVEVTNYPGTVAYLRLRKVGTTYHCDYKATQQDPWTTAGSTTYSGSVLWVGLMGKTWDNVAVTTDYDYFTLTY